MAKRKLCTLQIHVFYDDDVITPDDLADTFDRVLVRAPDAEGVNEILKEAGYPQFADFTVVPFNE